MMEIRGSRISFAAAASELIRHDKAVNSAGEKISRLTADLERLTAAISGGVGDIRMLLRAQARIAARRARWGEILLLRHEVERQALAVFEAVKKDDN